MKETIRNGIEWLIVWIDEADKGFFEKDGNQVIKKEAERAIRTNDLSLMKEKFIQLSKVFEKITN